jgi:selenocysteine lyase/cysteine desulfurase
VIDFERVRTDTPGVEHVAHFTTPARLSRRARSSTRSSTDFGARGLADAVRASVHDFNPDDEIDRLVDVVGPVRHEKLAVD